MATKFSDFTAQAATGTTFVVGYDGTTNTQYSQDNMTNFVLDGTLTGNRTVNQDGNSLSWNMGTGSQTFTTSSSSGTWMNFRVGGGQKGALLAVSGGGGMYFRDSGGSDYYSLSQNGLYLNKNAGFGIATQANQRVTIKGEGTTNGTYALRVQDSDSNDIIKALDDRTIGLGYNGLQITTEPTSSGVVKLNNISGAPLFSAGVVAGSTGKINVYGGYYNTFEYAASKGLVFTNQAGFNVSQDLSSMLTCVSSTKGFLPPRMTTTQRDAINSGTFTTGLTLYNTTDNKLQFYNGTAWTDAGGGGDNIYTADGTIASTTRRITTTGTSNIIWDLSGNSRFYINSLYVLPTGRIFTPSGGGFTINSFGTSLVGGNLALYSGTHLTGSNSSGYLTVSGTANTADISARLGVIGKSTTSTTDYAFRVQDSAAADMLTVRDDGAFALGKSASPQGASAVTIGELAETTVSNSIAIGYNAEAAGGIAIGQNADNNQSYSQCIGGNTSNAAQYQTVIGYDADGLAGADRSIAIGASAKAAAQGGIAIGVGANAQNHCIILGRNVGVSGTPDNSVVFSTRGGNNITYSEADSFTWYNTSDTVPDLKFKPGSNSYWNSSSNFGFGNGNTSPTATVDIDGTFRLRSATNVNYKVLTADANGNGTWQDPSYSPTISVQNTNGGDVDLYDDDIVRLWLDDGSSDDIELEITNYASSTSSTYHVNYTNFEGGASSARTTTVDLNQSGATSISTLDFDFTTDECMKLRIWSPRLGLGVGGEGSGFPFYEITIVKSSSLYTGSPVITSVLKSTS